jgi:hypothetical protein
VGQQQASIPSQELLGYFHTVPTGTKKMQKHTNPTGMKKIQNLGNDKLESDGKRNILSRRSRSQSGESAKCSAMRAPFTAIRESLASIHRYQRESGDVEKQLVMRILKSRVISS